jgi:hypothetical protein
MQDSFLEGIKLVGSVIGLASGVFLVYDRLFRNYPIIYLAVSDYWPALCLKNVTSETIVIDEIKITPDLLHARGSNDRKSRSQEKAEFFHPLPERDLSTLVVLKPSEERRFVLAHTKEEFGKLSNETVVRISCRWKNTRFPVPWPRHVKLWTKVKLMRDLHDAALAGKTT